VAAGLEPAFLVVKYLEAVHERRQLALLEHPARPWAGMPLEIPPGGVGHDEEATWRERRGQRRK
jgi:hypothetical protein